MDERAGRIVFYWMPIACMCMTLLLSVELWVECADDAFGRTETLDVAVLDKEYIPPKPRFSGKYLMTFAHERIGEMTWEVSAREYDRGEIGWALPMEFYFGRWSERPTSHRLHGLALMGCFFTCPLLVLICTGGLYLMVKIEREFRD